MDWDFTSENDPGLYREMLADWADIERKRRKENPPGQSRLEREPGEAQRQGPQPKRHGRGSAPAALAVSDPEGEQTPGSLSGMDIDQC